MKKNRLYVLCVLAALICIGLGPESAWAFKTADKVEVLWSGVWYSATVVKTDADKCLINFDGYDSSWDEWVGPDRIRAKGASSESTDKPTKEAKAPDAIPDWKNMSKDQLKNMSAKPELTPDPKAAQRRKELGFNFQEGDRVEVLWFGWWTEAKILKKKGDLYLVGFKESDRGFDEWVGTDRLRHMLWKDTFVVKLTKPNPSLIDQNYQAPGLKTPDPALPEVQKSLRDLAQRHARLAEELGKLPDLQDGITPKEKAALQVIMDIFDREPKLMGKVFEAMDQIGLPKIRRYNTPLQALFWMAQNSRPAEVEKLIKNYSLSALLKQAWNFKPAALWNDLDIVADRMNAPELINYFIAKAFIYNWDYFNEYLEPKTILEKRTGVCVHFAILGTHCLANAGYDVTNYSIFWGDNSYRTGHAVTVVNKNNLLYIVVDSEKLGIIQGPFKTFDDVGAAIARGPIHRKTQEQNAELLYHLKGEYVQ
ncbi:MAG: hypothetical protein HQK55_04605 [Deltaproteobacteria bacterium]|nr:hypothetical protein [Deltaproteobacteria bacterium]